MIVIAIVVWIFCGIGAGFVAKDRGADGGMWFAVGFLLGPFGLAAAFLSGSQQTCQFCRRRVHPKAKKCPYCQSQLDLDSIQQDALRSVQRVVANAEEVAAPNQQVQPSLPLPALWFRCATCNRQVLFGIYICDCGQEYNRL